MITNAQKLQLNKMNRAAQNVSLGSIIQTLQGYVGASGSVLVSAAQASASKVSVVTGVNPIVGFNVQAFTSGSVMSGVKVVTTGSNLTVTAGSLIAATPKALAANDVVNWIVW